MKEPTKALHKAQRLIVLMQLHDEGKLEGLTLRQLREDYFPEVDESTISRDRAALPLLLQRISDIIPPIPPKKDQ